MNGNLLKSEVIIKPGRETTRARRWSEAIPLRESDAVEMEDYNIGPQLKSLRKTRNMTLQFVAVETGMSAALLSQIENGNVMPSLKTLSKLASYYQIRLGKLFECKSDAPRYEIFRKSDGGHENLYEHLVRRNQGFCNPLLPFGPRKKMSCFLFDLRDDSGITTPLSVNGETLLFVIAGKIEICKEGELYAVEAGDSVYLDNSVDIDVKPVHCSRAKVLRVETA